MLSPYTIWMGMRASWAKSAAGMAVPDASPPEVGIGAGTSAAGRRPPRPPPPPPPRPQCPRRSAPPPPRAPRAPAAPRQHCREQAPRRPPAIGTGAERAARLAGALAQRIQADLPLGVSVQSAARDQCFDAGRQFGAGENVLAVAEQRAVPATGAGAIHFQLVLAALELLVLAGRLAIHVC